MNDQFFKELREKVKPYFEKVGGHEFDHVHRVFNNAITISKGEDVDLDVVKAAALLHDIARSKDDNNEVECHAKEGAKMAREILEDMGFPKDKIENVCHAIEVHRYSKGLKPKTKEAEIIQDADRLDALGALVVVRVISRAVSKGYPVYDPDILPKKVYDGSDGTAINHFLEKILKLTPDQFHTKKAREIAKGRYAFVEQFVDRFIKEWEGEL
ncbi:MAG: HD domain-containing protein [archaeon]